MINQHYQLPYILLWSMYYGKPVCHFLNPHTQCYQSMVVHLIYQI